MDYYKTLNIPKKAKLNDIKKAYRELVKKYHPDINHSPNAKKIFEDIQKAYDVLADPEKKKAYDESLKPKKKRKIRKKRNQPQNQYYYEEQYPYEDQYTYQEQYIYQPPKAFFLTRIAILLTLLIIMGLISYGLYLKYEDFIKDNLDFIIIGIYLFISLKMRD